MKTISELGTTLRVTGNRSTLERIADYLRKEEIEWDTRESGGGRKLGCFADL
jgi:hypothetical protein